MNLNEAEIDKLKNDLKSEILNALDKKFFAVDNRFDDVDRRFTAVEKRLDVVDKHFESVNNRFNHVEKRFDHVDNNLERVAVQCLENGKSIDKINKKIDRYFEFEKDVLAHERILKEHAERMGAIEKNVETITCALRNNEVSRQK